MEHKNPADRSHFWERPERHDERPAAPVDPNYPRHMHKADGEFLEVHDDEEFERALAAGWAVTPPIADLEG
jgi:hypothetical protein